ncbi:MAG: hypothetical protein KDB65_06430 [Calditrichaeota bacterium]|nr:hypothetical protein [Calditrichota bacterium]MCB9369771.1 hypothetical protein [Calditrichota bacterium]
MRTTFLALTLALTTSAFADYASNYWFALLPPSPAANGRAGIFLGPEDADPFAAWANPGLLGLMAQTQNVSAGFYPNRTKWSPGEGGYWNLNQTFSARAVFAGLPISTTSVHEKWLPIGISYTEQRFDEGEYHFYNAEGMEFGTASDWYDVARGLHVGLATQNSLWRFGAGAGGTQLYSHLPWIEANELTYKDLSSIGIDAGLWLDNNAVASANRLFKFSIPRSISLRPSLGFSFANAGPSARFDSDSPQFPLPRMARVSMGLSAAYELERPDGKPLKFVSVDFAATSEDDLVKFDDEGDVSYQFPPGDINPLRDVLFGKRNDELVQRHGFEIGFLEILTYSRGSFINDYQRALTVKTEGWGASLRGVLNMVNLASHHKSLDWLARHVDLRYYQSEESVHSSSAAWDTHPRDGTTYKGFVLSYLR